MRDTVKDGVRVDERAAPARGGNRFGEARRPRIAAVSGKAGPRQRVEALDGDTLTLLRKAAPILLRSSLGIVFIWFGLLKIVGVSAVGGLVGSTVPFLDSSSLVPVLGIVEVGIGAAFVTGRFLRLVTPVFALHLAGTFLVLILLPEVAFENNNPLLLTVTGEFVVKNLVLLSAGLVVASAIKPLRSRTQNA